MFFIMTLFLAHVLRLYCICALVCVQDRGCESRGRPAAVHGGAGHADHWEHDRHLHRPGETAAAQQEHRAPQSQQRGTTGADSPQGRVCIADVGNYI